MPLISDAMPISHRYHTIILVVLTFCTVTFAFTGKGTTSGIKEIFLGRCAEFTSGLVNPLLNPQELQKKNCSDLWDLFFNAFAYKHPCNVTREAFYDFVKEAELPTPPNKAVLWDGWDIYDTMREYVNEAKRANSLEFLLTGYLINQLIFCGKEESPGINYDVCPDWGECGFTLGPADGFWAAASQQFGANSNGNVKLILNSNRPGGSFQTQNSYFANIELLNLDPRRVTRLDIYLVTSLGDTPGDTCDTGTILELKSILTNKGINYECIEQPRSILHLLCADNITNDQCQLNSPGSKVSVALFDITVLTLISVVITSLLS